MRYALLALALLLVHAAALAANQAVIHVPSDSTATYTVVSMENLGGGNVQITTKRVGPSGTSYAKRLVDCDSMQFKYLAEGDSLEELDSNRHSLNMASLVTGSISYHVFKHACQAVSP